jgi:hypothetical protein
MHPHFPQVCPKLKFHRFYGPASVHPHLAPIAPHLAVKPVHESREKNALSDNPRYPHYYNNNNSSYLYRNIVC